MPNASTIDDRADRAARLAHDVAPDLDAVLITHYPDADTLDTMRPGDANLAAVLAENQAVARAMAEAGVEVIVQRADRAAFRRWMSGRDDIPANRHAWIDRPNLLRGADALTLLGLAETAPDLAPNLAPDLEPVFGPAPGPIADRLLAEYGEEDEAEFDALVQALMAAGRTDVLDLAIRKLRERGDESGDEAGGDEAGGDESGSDEAGDDLDWVFLVAAEGAAIGPSGWAELVALPVALAAGDVTDGEAVAAGLVASGALVETEEVRLLPGWRSPDALAALSFGAIRRVLLDMVDGKPPRDLPPGDTDDLARRGFGVLVGLRIDWDIPVWEAIAAAGGLPAEPDDDEAETPEAARFDQWRGRVFQDSGCVPLDLVAFSQVGNEIADFLAEAGTQTGGLADIRAAVDTCRGEAGGEEVVCHLEVDGDTLELAFMTEAGRALDTLSLPADRLPVRAEEMAPLIGAFVRLV